MSEWFAETKAAWANLKLTLSKADEDDRRRLRYWAIGSGSMAAAIVTQFGWSGALFCFGFFLWWCSGAEADL